MPARNTVREYEVPGFYHVYNRGAGGQKIFRDTVDKRKFLSLLRRHLIEDPNVQEKYSLYDVEVTAYCLMGNHFHLLLYIESDPEAITGLMKSVMTAYSMYFNLRHKTSGHLFQGVYRASRIQDEAYLLHITRYIHLNPREYLTYRWSSLRCYVGDVSVDWLKSERVMTMSKAEYGEFLEDYVSRRDLLAQIKQELAL